MSPLMFKLQFRVMLVGIFQLKSLRNENPLHHKMFLTKILIYIMTGTFAFKQLYVFTLHDCLSEKSLQGWMEKLDVFWMLFIKTFSTYSRSQNFLLLNIFNPTTMIWTELYWIPCLSCKRFRKILVTGKDKKWVLVFAVFKY